MALYLVIVESTGESEDDQKISWKELYSSGIKRACQRFAEKSARNRCGSMTLSPNILPFGEKGRFSQT